ncbi:hypothetical protein GCM10008090_06400 [Arenicella chitinivorans]|uniref:Serine aminopeptidase S33 domain-containing protein n=1 Tax=Arenicella chitinivorans TaxID=1329800 RepID=A0A918VIL5_9GAMM|nr:alpha/beta fold hydrolase [Arenicella chitinivorans]GHA00373.1 hypothetical protein GCM10008090_06400 [Arenicella chitinivorans]
MKTCVLPGLLSILMVLSSPCTIARSAVTVLPGTPPETREVRLESLSEKSATLRFIAADGASVTGKLLLPESPHTKLAVLLHPMGSDLTFWTRTDHSMRASRLSNYLRQNGYAVIMLDARLHGRRAVSHITARDLLKSAHSADPTLYHDTIQGTVRDYASVLAWARTQYQPKEVLIMGYSMGAQMSLILAAQHPSIDHVVVMVPPYVAADTSPVAPRMFTAQILQANVLWLAAKQDEHSTTTQTQATFDLIPSKHKRLVWLDSAHRLPSTYTDLVLAHLEKLSQRPATENKP